MDLHEAIKKYELMERERDRLIGEYTTRRDAIMSYVKEDLDDLDAEMLRMISIAGTTAQKLLDDAKAEVLKSGESAKGDVYHFVYAKGAVTWDGQILKGMAEIIPELKKAQKVGDPTVRVTKLKDVVK